MSQERREDRESRRKPRDDEDREYRSQRRSPRVEIQYIFAVNERPKPPEVHGDRFRLGDIVSTSEGPHKVIEVYWLTEAKARVLLRPVEKEQPEKAKKKAQSPKKFNVKGTQTSRLPARSQNQRSRSTRPKPVSKPAPRPALKPASRREQ